MKNLFRPISTVSILSLLLALIYMQSQSIDLSHFQKARHILTEIEYQRSQLESDMLRIHNGNTAHYDDLKYTLRALKRLKKQLRPQIPKQLATFAQLKKECAIQATTIEQFLTYQSLLTNSLLYLPKAIAAEAAHTPQKAHHYIKLHRDVLQYLRNHDHNSLENIKTFMAMKHVGKPLQKLINHTIKRQAKALAAIANYHDSRLNSTIKKIRLGIDQQLKKDIASMELYQFSLITLSLILITYIGWIVWKLTQSTFSLQQAIQKIKTQKLALGEHAIIGTTDQHGNIIYVNDKFCEISGYSQGELLGKNHRILNSNYHSKKFFKKLWKTIAKGNVWHGLIRNQCKDNSYYWVDTTIVPFLNEHGKPYQYISVRTGVTRLIEQEEEQQLHQQKLEHAQRLESLGVLAGGIAHDFNNLLTVIMGNTGLIDRELPANSSARDKLSRVISASEKAANLCKQMLAYSGKGHFIIQECDFSNLVEEMIDLLLVSIDKNVVIKYELAENLPTIEADIAQIHQVIMNLITNANEAIHGKSGVITISTGWLHADHNYLKNVICEEHLDEGDYVYLEVSDNGCGMDKKTIQKIFDPFFTTKFTGRGLGMSALHGIIRGHRGAIKIYSELGRGTTFKILLPASKHANASRYTDVKHEYNAWESGGGIALVVDDEEMIREMAGAMLRDMGFDILEAENGLEAVKLYPKHADNIRFVLLDMSMPKMDGEETFRELRKLNPKVCVILSSGYNEQEATQRFNGKGLAGFVQKPYLPDTLQETVKKSLE